MFTQGTVFWKHQLCLNYLLLATVKTQLYDIICNELLSPIVTWKTPIPVEVCNGLQIQSPNLKTMHEEADFSPSSYLASLGCCNNIKFNSEDTNVFVLLVF